MCKNSFNSSLSLEKEELYPSRRLLVLLNNKTGLAYFLQSFAIVRGCRSTCGRNYRYLPARTFFWARDTRTPPKSPLPTFFARMNCGYLRHTATVQHCWHRFAFVQGRWLLCAHPTQLHQSAGTNQTNIYPKGLIEQAHRSQAK